MKQWGIVLFLIIGLCSYSVAAKKSADEDPVLKQKTFSGLQFRSIGPALTSGRIADFAVNRENPKLYYVAVASGHIWKTENGGITFKPIFDNYGAYSIGCVAMDPTNPHVVWAGTGENNSQRALGYGNGVYKTQDGGKSWKNMGLKESRQIGKILIDPENPQTVYVAAEGSVWGPGGERGLYKTTDGGATWERVLYISENTGVSDLAMDPRDSNVIYAAAHQRRRHVFTKIDGGPESAIYKTTNAGKSWEKLSSGLPSADMGAIGLAVSPVNPDIVYAIVEAAGEHGGFFRSTDRGASWKKQSGYMSTSPQYYNEIFADPRDENTVYSMDTVSRITVDGGKTFRPIGNSKRHVDDHALWIDPGDTAHLLIGGDGGIYESYDRGRNWHFKPNLPVTQYYRVNVDNSEPFYYVYGGTQDNNSMGGPSRTISADGIVNADWHITQGGDGFWTAIDPQNPDIVYAEAQYGWAVRYDRRSGERVSIQPQPPAGEAYRWNWNAPLIISPHSHKRLYFAANKLFRSDDYGNTWKPLGGDLTRRVDRNQLKVMGRLWSVDAVAKNASTSLYGTIVSLDESPLVEGLLYVGTDDGLIQVSEDGGENWRRMERFPGIPEYTYVSDLLASPHDGDLVFAAFDNRKRDDFKPYLLRSEDRGRTWTSIAGNLPENGTVHSLLQDSVRQDLLLAGTEFGVWFSIDAGKNWIRLKGGLPDIAVRDMVIQEREKDLVLATFGRGFYILDDFSPLREVSRTLLEKPAVLFPVKDALMYIEEGSRYGTGASYYTAENPPFGAVFTYYLKDSILTRREKRQKAEKEARKKNQPIRYPSWEELRLEDREPDPFLMFEISTPEGEVVRRLKAPARAGMKRIAWDFRQSSTDPADEDDQFSGNGVLSLPGEYRVSLYKNVDGRYTRLTEAVPFRCVPLQNTTLPAGDRQALVAFHKKIAELNRVVRGTVESLKEAKRQVEALRGALTNTPGAPLDLHHDAYELSRRLDAIRRAFYGDETIRNRNESQPPGIYQRMRTLVYSQWRSTSAPTTTMKEQYQLVRELFAPQWKALKSILEKDLMKLKERAEKAGAPWSRGRLPRWPLEE